ncbi:ubiquitin thioesterase OTU1-like isoform X2 [Montipora foliosa]|uniref:ubiquitin thioesterase OTU1-like isoform X2 n=1 Tax=Montipora foliosa TaxID=591990 RepID=UPI0035F1D1E0
MAPLVLRCQYKGGRRNKLEGLLTSSTVSDLQEKIWLVTEVPPHAQRILSGFPPKQLLWKTMDDSLSSMDIRSGDTLIIEEDKKVPCVSLDSYKKLLSGTALGKITRKVVPADNSCLFSSVSYVMLGNTSYASELRNLIAKCVSSDPQTYNAVFLGRSNSDYCNWILDKEHWGGEGSGYSDCVYLVYDGIHYDPLAVIGDNSNEPLQTLFPVGDDMRLAEALEIAATAKKKRQFANLSQFSLRCLVCDTPLTGQQAAQAHAVSTGHINFGEV